jgi:hypothetical protein
MTLPLAPKTWTAIALLLQRPYLGRLWILQENEAANSLSILKYGATEVLWYYVRRALIRCQSEISALLETSVLLDPARSIYASKLSGISKTQDPTQIFEIESIRKCSEPRNKVFAILGLLQAKLAQQIQTLYSHPLRDVYMQAFIATVRTTRRLGLLECAGSQSSISNNGSWIPDFTQSMFERYTVEDVGLASCYSPAHAKFEQPLQLHVDGIISGRIQAVMTNLTRNAMSDWPEVHQMIKQQSPGITEEECLEAYLWTITQGDLEDRWHQSSITPDLAEAKAIFRLWCSNTMYA